MVFTIEPSVTSKLGTCNLEQDVLVTSNGYQELRQGRLTHQTPDLLDEA
ncbi:MAG TPA: hypothetical protein VEL71_07810 [Candidatus Dormibacteraeota bacterium]|nr:hypothetical protein [Candidatus Dormibacteraeota bacterium]